MSLKRGVVVLSFLMSVGVVFAQEQNNLVGVWEDVSHPEKKIKIEKKGDQYFGTELQNASKQVLKNLKYDEKSQNYSGYIINPDNGDEIAIELELTDKDSFQFSVGVFIFKKTFKFQRI